MLIDASIWIFRAHFSLPDDLVDDRGRPAAALSGWAGFLLDELAARPAALGVAFDESLESGFRHRLFPAYKAARSLPDEALARQLDACRRLAEGLGLCCAASSEFEADDLIAAAATRARAAGRIVEIVSRDKDLLQLLVDPRDCMRDAAGGRRFDRDAATLRFGVAPERIADLQALAGDPVDGIPGIRGVGARTAACLLQRHGDLEGLFDALDADAAGALAGLRGARRLAGLLAGARAEALCFRELTRAHAVVDVAFEPHLAPAPVPTREQARVALADVGLGGRFGRRVALLGA
ncbi:MAG TPA: 5'-3' exonuclease H3TH domain-containing protein [Pseudomonadales bacterium]|nr:5'-3' exonuclease H3TH domain-containing protein [Pseudomonadales bacterium]